MEEGNENAFNQHPTMPNNQDNQYETLSRHQESQQRNRPSSNKVNIESRHEQVPSMESENRNSPDGKDAKPEDTPETNEPATEPPRHETVPAVHTSEIVGHKHSATPRTEVHTTDPSMSRETTDVSLDLELEGPTHDKKEAQYLLVRCQLCSQNMRMPKMLQCLHSFCEQCLEGYVKKLVDRSKTTTITCPLCHTVVLISRGKINAREYVESLPISTIVSTVLSKKAAITRLCNVCKSDVNRAICWCGYCALAFCDEHVQYHKQLTSLKHRHPTISLDDIGRNKPTMMFPYQKCHFHKKEDLHLFCKEEWILCCHVCRKMLHKQCDVQKGSVVPLSNAATKVKDGKHAKNLSKRLEALREESETISEDRMKNLDELELQLRLGRESISTIRNCINDHLDHLEDGLHDELKEIYERTRTDLEEERDKAEIKLRTVVHFQNILENIHIHSPDTQAISEMSHLRHQTKFMESDVRKFKRKARTFEISITTYAEYFKQISRMGALQRREISAYKMAPVPAPTRTKTNFYKAGSKSTF